MNPRRWLTVLLLVGTAALAEPADPRGWTAGTPAVGAARILAGPGKDADLPVLEFPSSFAKKLSGRTLLFYFSPTCPHCTAVAEELGNLDRALPEDITVLGVATGSSLPLAVAEFKSTYAIDFEIIIDEERTIGAAMGARSTPSVLMVDPAPKHKATIVDAWYPYQPGYDLYVKMRAAKDPWSVFGGYLGNGSCVGCHQQEGEAWALTHHSIAWRTLVEDEKHTDPKCVGCHVTGFEQPGGWKAGADALTGVGCEACHGPSGPHDGERVDAKTTCAGCHDAEHSIQFTVAKGMPLIDHFATNGMDDETFRSKRIAVVDGTAPRSLLAFAADATSGAEACKECHEAEYAQWKGSGHAKAMQVLRDQEKEGEVGCVKCHATASRGGPPPSELSEYRVAESVGCEACHGPGGAHIAAKGGTDNIEKLGDDCPVCVIEAVCTSCHTSEFDKDWDLDTHLPKVGHGKPTP